VDGVSGRDRIRGAHLPDQCLYFHTDTWPIRLHCPTLPTTIESCPYQKPHPPRKSLQLVVTTASFRWHECPMVASLYAALVFTVTSKHAHRDSCSTPSACCASAADEQAAGVPINGIKEYAGHASIVETQKYLKFMPQSVDLAADVSTRLAHLANANPSSNGNHRKRSPTNRSKS